ncbi:MULTISPECIES: glycosyltransferase family 2 protein [unclassified Acinetobacter]|uniref:glycosyltransferase family 2 protein n=1 Tax=unclassified Acinetobacter TaxID=196816 RepID=UPI00293451BD|nr:MULTISPECIES: glycosyltransferase family 2 protein [unclassified Acinetobacter]WOE30898.1 glycosyltransferase family 2 protein [Acinetobacter sp. SAAs470]WOE39093.1 glycosyltransferase family 2 protein [Acinetobacter sp. SAAs474]
MSKNSFISIGIPFYNAELFLEDAIKSILAQTYPYWELILVNDGSTDKSLEIAKKYVDFDSRIRLINDGLNKKLPFRLNQIIHEAKYDYIARMDADDLIAIDRLTKQIRFLENNTQYDLITTGMYSIDNKNKILGKRILKNYHMSAPDMLNGLTNLLHASMLARKTWCLRNLYEEKNSLAEDYELWLSANIKNDLKYYVIEEPLYYYREGENVKKEKMIKGYNTQIQVIEKYYKNIISDNKKNKIIKKFKIKKIIVLILDKLNLMYILQRKRVTVLSHNDFLNYSSNLEIIYKFGL